MGGGRQCLTWNITNKPNDPIDAWSCKRGDGRDLIQQWKTDKMDRRKSFGFVGNTRELEEVNLEATDFLMGEAEAEGPTF